MYQARRQSVARKRIVSTFVGDPIPSGIVGASIINHLQDEVLAGIITVAEFRHWGGQLAIDGFSDLAREIFARTETS
jgi:hypothetical protein